MDGMYMELGNDAAAFSFDATCSPPWIDGFCELNHAVRRR